MKAYIIVEEDFDPIVIKNKKVRLAEVFENVVFYENLDELINDPVNKSKEHLCILELEFPNNKDILNIFANIADSQNCIPKNQFSVFVNIVSRININRSI